MRQFLRSFILAFLLTSLAIAGLACTPASTPNPAPAIGDGSATGGSDHGGPSEWACATYTGHTLHTGSKGRYHYSSSNGNKAHVERSCCNC